MNLLKTTTLILFSIALFGCATKLPEAKHSSGKGISQIDNLVSELLPEYIEDCYEPIRSKDVPHNACQTTLFDVLERRHGMSFSPIQLNRIAEELFFTQYIADRLNSLVRSDPRVRKQVKRKFKSKQELVSYYRKAYSFEQL
jgi:hypothetical protein